MPSASFGVISATASSRPADSVIETHIGEIKIEDERLFPISKIALGEGGRLKRPTRHSAKFACRARSYATQGIALWGGRDSNP